MVVHPGLPTPLMSSCSSLKFLLRLYADAAQVNASRATFAADILWT